MLGAKDGPTDKAEMDKPHVELIPRTTSHPGTVLFSWGFEGALT